MTIPTLTFAERVILANQYRLLEVLHPDAAPDYRARRAVVEGGFESEYDETLRGLEIMDPVSSTACEEVVGILGMFRALYGSYTRLSEADKQGVDADRVRFRGFDGNEETREFRYARFMIQDDRWGEFKPEDDDQHRHGAEGCCPMEQVIADRLSASAHERVVPRGAARGLHRLRARGPVQAARPPTRDLFRGATWELARGRDLLARVKIGSTLVHFPGPPDQSAVNGGIGPV